MKLLTKERREFYEGLLKYKPVLHNNYYVYFPKNKKYGIKKYKKSRVTIMLYTNLELNQFELVHHKDGNKINDLIENLEILNNCNHADKHDYKFKKKPKGWKPANTTPLKIQERIKEMASKMIKVNYSEIKRNLEKEEIFMSSFTVSKYC